MGGGPVYFDTVRDAPEQWRNTEFDLYMTKSKQTANRWAHGYDGQMAGMLEAANISKPWWWIKDEAANR